MKKKQDDRLDMRDLKRMLMDDESHVPLRRVIRERKKVRRMINFPDWFDEIMEMAAKDNEMSIPDYVREAVLDKMMKQYG